MAGFGHSGGLKEAPLYTVAVSICISYVCRTKSLNTIHFLLFRLRTASPEQKGLLLTPSSSSGT